MNCLIIFLLRNFITYAYHTSVLAAWTTLQVNNQAAKFFSPSALMKTAVILTIVSDKGLDGGKRTGDY